MNDLTARLPSTYSRYLRPLSSVKEPALVGRLARRWSLTVLLAGTLGPLAYGTRARWFAPDGPGYVAYWLHDRLYLPLKGNLWTAWFPQSMVPWTVVALLLAVWLAGWLSGRPLTRALHAALTRRALAHRVSRPLLDRWHALTVRSVLHACHLELMVEQMRGDMLDAIDAGDDGSGKGGRAGLSRAGLSYESCANRLSAITMLSARWRLRTDNREAIRLAVAADLLEARLRIGHGADGTGARAIGPALERLSALLESILSDLSGLAPIPADDPFAPAALAADAAVLLRASAMRLTSGRSADPATLRPVAANVMERCNRLNAIRFAVERGLCGHGRDIAAPTAAAPACGRLALLIALAAAQEAAEPELAQATLDSMSGLDFARSIGLPAPARAFADLWLAEAPDLPHWRIAARLVWTEPQTCFEAADLTTAADLTHLNEPMHRLAWIAGAPETIA